MKRLPTKAHFGLQRYEQIFKLPNYKDNIKSTPYENLQDIDFINIYFKQIKTSPNLSQGGEFRTDKVLFASSSLCPLYNRTLKTSRLRLSFSHKTYKI